MPETPSPQASPPSRPAGVRAVRTRRADGTEAVYWYCRITGTRLPDIADPGFAAAVETARRKPAPTHGDGTLGALLADWRASQEYRATAPATRDVRERYMKAIGVPEWSGRQVAMLPPAEFLRLRKDLLAQRDAIADERGNGAATIFGAGCAAMFGWAVHRGVMAISPMTKIKALDGGHIPTWTEAEAQHAMTKWPAHLRRPVTLAYYIGQRRGDLAALRWDAYDAARGIIELQPEKTRRKREAKGRGPLRIPVQKALAWELAAWRAEAPDATHILLNHEGKPWPTKNALSHAMRKRLQAEGWDTKKGLHGLRKLRASTFAEAGASTKGIGAAMGFDTLAMQELYTANADQEKLARGAVRMLEKRVAKTGKTGR